MNLEEHLERQQKFSAKTFGPPTNNNWRGAINHIRKELLEIEEDPTDLEEWIDVILLAFDGAWRSQGGAVSPREIVDTLAAKLSKNENRSWPDWKKAEPGKAIEHIE